MCISVTSCCFCVSLDLGAKVISIISTITSVLTTLVYGTVVLMPSPVPETRRLVYAGVATLSMFQLLIATLLIYGTFWKKPRWMIPWIATSWTLSVVLVVLSVMGAVLIILRVPGIQETETEVSTMVSVYFIHAVLLYYFTSVVDSRRDEMISDDSTDSAQRLLRQRGLPKTVSV